MIKSKKFSATKTLLLCVAIMLILFCGTLTYAYFTDSLLGVGEISFSKIELSDTTSSGELNLNSNIIPGKNIIDSTNKILVGKTASSPDIYIRARASFTSENATLNSKLDTTNATFMSILNDAIGNSVYSGDYGYTYMNGYFYLTTATNGNTLKAINNNVNGDLIFIENLIAPMDLPSFPNNEQEGALVNFNIVFQAVQAVGVSDNLTTTESIFNSTFSDYSILVSSNNEALGTVTKSGGDSYSNGDTVTLEATAIGNGKFLGFARSANDIIITQQSTYTFNVNSETEGAYVAIFADTTATTVVTSGNLKYTIYNGTNKASVGANLDPNTNGAILVGGEVERLVIPAGFENLGQVYQVISIDGSTFDPVNQYYFGFAYHYFTTIDIPETVLSIGDYAFYYCAALTNIDLKNVETIGIRAFAGTISLNNIIMPNIISVGESAFNSNTPASNSSNIRNVVTNKNMQVASSAFNVPSQINAYFIGGIPSSAIGNFNVGNSYSADEVNYTKLFNYIKTADKFIIYGIKDYTTSSVVIPNTLYLLGESKNASIFEGAFTSYMNLREIRIPFTGLDNGSITQSSTRYISKYDSNYGTTRIIGFAPASNGNFEVPSNIMGFVGGTFDYFNGNITFAGTNYSNVERGTFNRFNGRLYLPSTITIINSEDFQSCEYIRHVDMPNVQQIYSNAFTECYSLKSVNMPNISSIYAMAFYGCKSLESVDLRNLSYLQEVAFLACDSLESIYIGNNLNTVDFSLGYNAQLLGNQLYAIFSTTFGAYEPNHTTIYCTRDQSYMYNNINDWANFEMYANGGFAISFNYNYVG